MRTEDKGVVVDTSFVVLIAKLYASNAPLIGVQPLFLSPFTGSEPLAWGGESFIRPASPPVRRDEVLLARL